MTKAIITGGAGFIGVELAKHLLQQGCRVTLVDNFARGRDDAELAALKRNPLLECLSLDMSKHGVTDQLGVEFDYVFHFAAILGVANVIERPYETLSLNVALAVEAIRLARRQNRLRSFVFASTSEVYAGSLFAGLLQFPSSENSMLVLPSLTAPRTSYMFSKLYGEALALQSGLPSVIVRPHNVYGPRMGVEHVVPELMKRMRATTPGSEFEVYSPEHTRTFCYIDDAVKLISALAQIPAAVGRAWNVGTQSPEYGIMAVAEVVRAVVGSNVVLKPGGDTAGSPSRRQPDMAATNAITGIHQRVSLEEGISRTFEWYRLNFFEAENAAAGARG